MSFQPITQGLPHAMGISEDQPVARWFGRVLDGRLLLLSEGFWSPQLVERVAGSGLYTMEEHLARDQLATKTNFGDDLTTLAQRRISASISSCLASSRS